MGEEKKVTANQGRFGRGCGLLCVAVCVQCGCVWFSAVARGCVWLCECAWGLAWLWVNQCGSVLSIAV